MRSRPSLRSVAGVLALLLVATSGAVSSAAADSGPGSESPLDAYEERRAEAPGATNASGNGEVSAAEIRTFTDPLGDEQPIQACWADIRQYTADYAHDRLSVSMVTQCPSSPFSDTSWTVGRGFALWAFDLDDDSAEDYVAVMYNDDGAVIAEVFDSRGASEPVWACSATPYWSGYNYFGITLQAGCIGSPSAIELQAYMAFDEAPFSPNCSCPYDVAPDDFGFSEPVLRTFPLPVGDGPGAASSGQGTVDVFVRGQDNALWTQHRDEGWGGWSSLGGIITGTPAAASAVADELDVFVRGQDNALWTRHHDGATWGGWRSLGGILTTPPGVVSSAPGTLDVFVAGNDRALYVNHFDGDAWSGWTSLGGIVSATPAAASSTPGTIDVFVLGQDNAVHTKRRNGAVWGGWQSLGGILASAPSAASPGAGTVDVFARGPDEALWSTSSVNGAWSGWVSLGGVISTPPAAVSAAPGTLDVFARGQDYALWTMHRDGNWSGWSSLGGIIR